MSKQAIKGFSLAALEGVAFSRDQKGELPTRLLVVPWGTTQTRKGLVVCNATTAEKLPALQEANKFDRVAFDFNHNTLSGQEPVKVAGYGAPEVVAGEGIYLSAIEYTEDGKEMLKGGHYPDISPSVVRNDKGEVIFLHSVGACRQGEIDGLTLFSAEVATPILSKFEAETDDAETDPVADEVEADLRAILIGLLNKLNPDAGLSASASDAEIASVARALSEEGPTAPVEVDAMSARLDKLEAQVVGTARSALVARAAAEGKVIPLSAKEIAKLDLVVLESMVEKLAPTVPMDSRIEGATDDFSASGPVVTPELREVARQLNLDPMEVAKSA